MLEISELLLPASDSHTNSSIYKGTGMSYFWQQKNSIPKLALEIRDVSLLALHTFVAQTTLDDRYVMFLCFQVHFRTKQTKWVTAEIRLNGLAGVYEFNPDCDALDLFFGISY